MAVVERARSTTSSTGQNSRETSLAAPVQRIGSKGTLSSSAISVASSDGHGDATSELHASPDGALDRRKSRGSDQDASSETSSHRRKISKLFKGRKGRRKSMQDDYPADFDQDVPPLPDMPTIKIRDDDQRSQSDESLGLHKSVASSLLTEDSESDP